MLVRCNPTKHAFTPTKIVFVSGLSDPATCALSDEQQTLLTGVEAPEDWKLRLNFPFVAERAEQRPTPSLVAASWQNVRQFLAAGRNPYRTRALEHWRAVADSTDRLVIVTLSCGLEILQQCLRADETRRRVRIIALGPVAWRVPDEPTTLVQGSRDWISRSFFSDADRLLPDVGHMDYVGRPDVLELVNQHLCDSTSKS